MIESLRFGQSLPDKAVVITFDDGLSNYMNWDQIKQMSDAGVIIANHMVDHPYMLEARNDESTVSDSQDCATTY